MKHLKRFSETLVESSINESHADDIILNVKDILIPISDMGYDISVTVYYEGLTIRVVSWGDKPLLITDEVKEEFMRMKDYLQSEGYNSIEARYYYIKSGQNAKPFDDFINSIDIEYPIENLIFVANKTL